MKVRNMSTPNVVRIEVEPLSKRNMSGKHEKGEVSKSSVSRNTQTVVSESSKQKNVLQKQKQKVVEKIPKSRHRKGLENEKCVFVETEKSGQKEAKLVQKERVLAEKIKEWDHFFNTERAVVKSDQEVFVRKKAKEGFGQKRAKLGEGFAKKGQFQMKRFRRI